MKEFLNGMKHTLNYMKHNLNCLKDLFTYLQENFIFFRPFLNLVCTFCKVICFFYLPLHQIHAYIRHFNNTNKLSLHLAPIFKVRGIETGIIRQF
jgi:hypothetical protein